MKVEIWSDVTCPHCYIAKRKFEMALSLFRHRDKIEIIWRSFELAPGFKTDPNKLLPQLLQELHGVSMEQVQEMISHVTQSAKQVGLEYSLSTTIPANSFNAHRVSHFAKDRGIQEKMEERMFRAYLVEGKNIDDIPTLAALAAEIGMNSIEVKDILESVKYTDEVNRDLLEARQGGITSVPKYVINANSEVLGVQDSTAYLQILEKEFANWQSLNVAGAPEIIEAPSCKIGEGCK